MSFPSRPSNPLALASLLAFLLLLAPASQAADFPTRPDSDRPIVDEAELLSSSAEDQIAGIITKLLGDRKPPIVVVTIDSLASKDAGFHDIESYARSLFDEWKIGTQKTNLGVLLLVSIKDRKARIELGADWGGGDHATSRHIMDDYIIPAFKRDDYETGIIDGVRALDAMIRAENLPTPTPPWWFYPVVIGFFILVIVIAVSLFRSGRTGWGWIFLIAVGALIFFAMRSAASGGGGSFGGGSSGGGGATGSW